MNDAAKTNVIVVKYTNNKNNEYNNHKKPPTSKGKKNFFKGSFMNVIKVVLYMLRKKGDKTDKKLSPSLPTSNTNVSLKNLVGAFRPLHLQRDVGAISPPPSQPVHPGHDVAEVVVVSSNKILTKELPYHPKNVASSSCSSSSGEGTMSTYASAQSLYDLDDHEDDDEDEDEDEDEEDAYYDGIEGDEMIDSKADMFIAKFYQQMRLQGSKTTCTESYKRGY